MELHVSDRIRREMEKHQTEVLSRAMNAIEFEPEFPLSDEEEEIFEYLSKAFEGSVQEVDFN